MKNLILVLAIVMISSMAYAEPILTSDPQEGVEEHLFECGTTYSVVVPALPDGSVWWDFATWTGGHGWFDCTVKARSSYAVVDEVTGVQTTVTQESSSAPLRIKVPNSGSNSNYVIQE